MPPPLGQVIASRRLSRRGRTTPVIVEIGLPQRRPTGEWACPYHIRGLKRQPARRALGEDAVQALALVFHAIRLELESYGSELSWLGEPGATGFYRFFPDIFGRRFGRRVERLIDREIGKELRRLKQRAAKRQPASRRPRRFPAAT